MSEILRVVGLVHRVDGRALLVRARHHAAFYLAGGKIEPGETELEALRREVVEELGVDLLAGSERFVGRYVTDAYGQGEGVRVDLRCYSAELAGTPAPAAEIAEMAWMTCAEYLAQAETAPAVVELMKDLDAA
ncbi:NUDIX domain-containing protein [Saccharopolyspora taberi]|uniref:8-oxo-dGTP diphosphatase n=1 Tax=Saccharopolyspora taberi TaxID=60895 RepID=A0ABN3VLQ5_9PSEU